MITAARAEISARAVASASARFGAIAHLAEK
jgi:hypothetical protein